MFVIIVKRFATQFSTMRANLLLVLLGLVPLEAFVIPLSRQNVLSSALQAGRGMGMAASAAKKKKKTGKTNKPPPFDVSAALARSEKRYDQLLLDANKRLSDDDDDIVTTEYVVAARDKTLRAVADWVPIAQLCMARDLSVDATSLLTSALSLYCRELSHIAGNGSRVLASLPRSDLEYAVEPVDSFYKHVYDVIMEGQTSSMTRKQALTVLGIEDDETLSLSDIKQSYRRRSFACHPDRVKDLAEDEQEQKALEYADVQQAFQVLSERGSSTSWYASLGGRARTDFVGPVPLQSLTEAASAMAACQSAVIGLDPDMVQAFVARGRVTK